MAKPNYSEIYCSSDNYYSVGIDADTGEPLIQVVITWVAWYSVYFRLTPEEFAAFQCDHEALTPLSYELAKDKGFDKFRDRLVHNEKPDRR